MFNYFKNIDGYLEYHSEIDLTKNLNTLNEYKKNLKIETTHTKYIGDIIDLLDKIIVEKRIDGTNYDGEKLKELVKSLQNKIKETDTQEKIIGPLNDGMYRSKQ